MNSSLASSAANVANGGGATTSDAIGIATRAAIASTLVAGDIVQLCDGDEAIYSHGADGDFEAEYMAYTNYAAGQIVLESKA